MMQKRHTVMAGENLSSIASKYGLPGWHALYFANENAEFRRSNKDPDQVFPGQVLVIPPNKAQLKQMLQKRLARLRKARLRSQELFNEQQTTLNSDLKEIKSTADAVDTTATVLMLLIDLSKLTKKAASIMKMGDEAASEAANQLGKEMLVDRGKNMRDLAAQAVADSKKESSNVAWLAAKSVAQSWCDITSPSFWANTYVNYFNEDMSWSDAVSTRPEDVFEDALIKLKATQSNVMQDFDKKIREVQQELTELNRLPLA